MEMKSMFSKLMRKLSSFILEQELSPRNKNAQLFELQCAHDAET